MSIKKTLILLFIFTIALLIGVGLYGAITYKKVMDESLQISDEYASMESTALTAQVHFKKQVQEWKNILLRGTDSNFYDQYLAQFISEEERTRKQINLLVSKLEADSNGKKIAQQFLTAHLRLGQLYREALPAFKSTAHDPHITVDKHVRGIDRYPTALIDHLVKQLKTEKALALKRLKAGTDKTLSSLAIVILVMLTSLIAIIVTLLKRTVIQPLIMATNFATEITAGNYTNTIKYGNTENESNRLLQALDSMQASLAESALEIAKNNKALRSALHEARESDQLRSDFIANLNHELITPMTGVLGLIDLLAETKLDQDQTEYVTLAKESGKRFLTTVNGVVNLSKIEGERFVITEQPFNLKSLMETISLQFSEEANKASLDFSLSIPDNLPADVKGDEHCLQHVISILLENAIKFTADGFVHLNVRVQAANQQECLVRFEVRDSGKGISAIALENIFEPFTQEDGSRSRSHEGLGIGLSVMKQIVELMGGEVSVNSTEGKGSAFTFNLPLEIERSEADKQIQ